MPDFSTAVLTAQNQVVYANSAIPGSYDSVARLGLGVYDVDEYRAGGTVTDTVALQSAVNAAKANGGGTVYVRAGRTLTITGMTVTSANDVRLLGDGPYQSKIVMSGVTDGALLRFTTCNRITVSNLWLYGNNVSTSDGPSGAAVYMDITGAAAAYEGFTVEHCRVENFKGGGWVRLQNPTNFDFDRVRFIGNVAAGGSDRAPGTIGTAAAMFACRMGTGSGNITDIVMERNECDAYTVKQALVCLQDNSGTGTARRVRIKNNAIRRAGVSNSTTVDGAYAIAVYGGAQDVVISGNTVDGARQAGVYVNICTDLVVANNVIRDVVRDQTNYPLLSNWDNSLPRGGVAINESSQIVVAGNTVKDCDIGIQVANNFSSYLYGGVGLSCTGNSVFGGSVGIALRGSGSNGYAVTGNAVVGQTDQGINLRRAATTATVNDMLVVGNTVTASSSATGYIGIGSPFDLYGDRWVVAHNTVDCKGTASSSAFVLQNSTATGIASGRIEGNYAANAANYGFSLIRMFCAFLNNTADTCGTAANAATGAFRTALARGTWTGNRVLNAPAATFTIEASGLGDLGLDTPTWAGSPGDTVQTQTPTSGQQWGWVYTGAAWKAFGTLA